MKHTLRVDMRGIWWYLNNGSFLNNTLILIMPLVNHPAELKHDSKVKMSWTKKRFFLSTSLGTRGSFHTNRNCKNCQLLSRQHYFITITNWTQELLYWPDEVKAPSDSYNNWEIIDQQACVNTTHGWTRSKRLLRPINPQACPVHAWNTI